MAFRFLPEMPCGPILELHGQRKRFHVPFGLKRLIEEMTREVLRFQPENIYEFLAGFMEARVQKKIADDDKSRKRKSWQDHRWSWQGGSVLQPEELEEFLDTLPAPVEEVNHHATVIQAAFRGYQARKKVKDIRKSVLVDQEKLKDITGQDNVKEDEEEEEEEHPHLENRRPTMEITTENATNEELRSAVIIQAAFRGMHARNEVKKLRGSIAEAKRKTVTEQKLSVDAGLPQEEKVPPIAQEMGEQRQDNEGSAKTNDKKEAGDVTQPENNVATVGNEGNSQGAPDQQGEPQVRKESQDRKTPQDGKESGERKTSQDRKESQERKTSQDSQDRKESQKRKTSQDSQDRKESQEKKTSKDSQDKRDSQGRNSASSGPGADGEGNAKPSTAEKEQKT